MFHTLRVLFCVRQPLELKISFGAVPKKSLTTRCCHTCGVQALREGVGGGKDGSFRATFEDKPLLSDTVFLRAWVAVDLPRLHNPVTNLLGPPPAPPSFPRARKAQEVRAVALPPLRPLPARACAHT